MKHAKFSPYAELSWLADINAIEVKWNKLHMTLEQFKEITDTVLKMLAINRSSTWIANQYDSTGVFSAEILEFITNELVGDAVANYGVKLVLTIMPKQIGLSSLSTRRWMTDVQKMDAFTMVNFETLMDCKKWVYKNG